MIGFLVASIVSFAIALLIHAFDPWTYVTAWIHARVWAQWLLWCALGVSMLALIAAPLIWEISTARTLFVIQSICGVLFGPALWYVIDHFRRIRKLDGGAPSAGVPTARRGRRRVRRQVGAAVTAGTPTITLQIVHHIWLSGTLGLLFLVGVYGAEIRIWLSRVEKLDLPYISFQIGRQAKVETRQFAEERSSNTISPETGLSILSGLDERIALDVDYLQIVGLPTADPSDEQTIRLAMRAHERAKALTRELLKPLASCVLFASSYSIDRELIKAELRKPTLLLRKLVMGPSSANNFGTEDQLWTEAAAAIAHLRDLSYGLLDRAKDDPYNYPEFRCQLPTDSERSRRGISPHFFLPDDAPLTEEPNTFLALALFELYNGNNVFSEAAMRDKFEKINDKYRRIFDMSTYNLNYWAASLLYYADSPTDFAVPSRNIILDANEHIKKVEKLLEDTGNNASAGKAAKLRVLKVRAAAAKLIAMNDFTYRVANARASNLVEGTVWWDNARDYASQLEDVASADSELIPENVRQVYRAEILDTVAYFSLVDQSLEPFIQADKLRRAKSFICTAFALQDGARTGSGPRSSDSQLQLHLKFANVLLSENDPC